MGIVEGNVVDFVESPSSRGRGLKLPLLVSHRLFALRRPLHEGVD